MEFHSGDQFDFDGAANDIPVYLKVQFIARQGDRFDPHLLQGKQFADL
jgi:hypothetical protein